MIHQIHKLLLSIPVTKRMQRRIVSKIKSSIGCPDAFDDLKKLIDRTSPDAYLDIGTHVGAKIARILESNSLPIHGFEPTPDSHEIAEKRFKDNSMVSIHNIALADTTGVAEFNFNANEQTNSLLDNDEGNLGALKTKTQKVMSQQIRTMRLDDWMLENAPNQNVVVKSDIQGAEGLLLAGGEKAFRSNVIGIYSEAQIAPMYKGQISFFDLNEILTKDFDFVLHNIYPCFHDDSGRALQTDAMWISKKFLKMSN